MTGETILIFTAGVILLCMVLSLITGLKKRKIYDIKLPACETWIPVSSGITEPVLFTNLTGLCEKRQAEIADVTWESNGYKCVKGDYVFTAVAPKGFKFDVAPEMKVHVVDKELFTVGDIAMSAENCLIKAGRAAREFGVYDKTGCMQLYDDIRTTKPLIAGKNVSFESGYISSCHLSSNTELCGGTFGYVYVENGAKLKILSKTEVQTLVACDGETDITEHKGFLGAVECDGDTIFKIVSRKATQLTRFDLSSKKFRLNIAGKEYKTIIKDFKAEDSYVVVAPGTPLRDIKLPDRLFADTPDGSKEVAVDWKCENYDGSENVYFFRPDALGYCIADNAKLPIMTVICADSGSVDTELVLPVDKTVIPVGTELDALTVLPSVEADCLYRDQHFKITLQGMKWNCIDYDYLKTGSYVFKPETRSVSSVFNISEISFEVALTDGKAEFENENLKIDSLAVLISASSARKSKITDAAKIYTYFEGLDNIENISLSGTQPVLMIDTPYSVINGEIMVSDIVGDARLDLYPSYIGKVRYIDEIAQNVILNGICAVEYLEKMPTTFKKMFFANGIPVVVSMDDDGETYVYRANNMKKISESVSYGCVFGGAYKDGVENTNVTFKSGVLYDLIGGGEKGNVYGETVSVLDGGLVSNNWYGGCISGDYCEKVICVFNDGAVKRDGYGGGADGSVGIAGKSYKSDEYSICIYMFGGIFTNFFYGAKSNCGKAIYGNIHFEMFDGVGLNQHCGSTDDAVEGNVSVAVYGGTAEKQFVQKEGVKGTTAVRAYRNVRINGDPENKFPFFTGCDYDRFYGSYFDTDYEFKYRSYDRDKSIPLSKDGDEGKLVIRFLEIKQPWQNKDNVRIANYTGDCMYITLPNGQNMIVDVPLNELWETVEADLRALGVDKIDYFVLTHYHGDHFGCFEKLVKAHKIGKFYLPNLNYRVDAVEGVLPEDADITRITEGDVVTIGEGDKAVKITFLNPPKYGQRAMVPANHNPFSACTVFEFGTSKMMLDADTYDKNEREWMYERPELISNVDVIKPGHHGITTSSRYDFFRMVNPEYVCITNLREYGCHYNDTRYMLEKVNKYPKDRIKNTGVHGMIKATMSGTHGDVEVVTEYTEK